MTVQKGDVVYVREDGVYEDRWVRGVYASLDDAKNAREHRADEVWIDSENGSTNNLDWDHAARIWREFVR